ncbi:MAG: hypothetical protein ACU0CC_20955 [Sagittula sp.]|uniref:hypothetical protein n=1 Tax=unclassified Sagittula TaxID=2624628 RepID=UPI0020C77521|nr:hypothetical protein [Sagittula sp. P11]
MTDPRDDTMPGAADDLSVFFEAARAEAPVPDGDFMARLTADALAEMPVPAARAPSPGFWMQVRSALGGWAGMTGLAAACAAGIWIGVNPPATLDAYWGDSTNLGEVGVDPLSGFELAMLEG